MIQRVKDFLISKSFMLLFLGFIYTIFTSIYGSYSKNEPIVIKPTRLDPEFIPKEQLFSILDDRGEVYNPKADHKLLVRLAKSKVQVEKSDPPKQIDLNKLTTAELQLLLDNRGIIYYSNSSIQDLMVAVNISGPVTNDGIEYMNRMGEPALEAAQECIDVEAKMTLDANNESVSLIHIIPGKRHNAYFNESYWISLRRKLTFMGFKFGELDCNFEVRKCVLQSWNTSFLLLHVPGETGVQFPIRKEADIDEIFKNIQTTLAFRIKRIYSWKKFTSSEWAFYQGTIDDVKVRVIFFTNMTEPPMFLSALSVKYKNRVKFGLVNMESRNGRAILKKLKQTHWPLCLIVTQQTILNYGGLPGEYFTYQALDIRLQSLLSDVKAQDGWSKHIYSFLLLLLSVHTVKVNPD